MTTRRTRVLIEHENPRRRRMQAADLEAAGFAVETCGGPAALPGRACPLVTCGQCDAAASADVIINELPLGQLGVYAVQHHELDDSRVLVGLSDADVARYPVLTHLPRVIARNAVGVELVDAVRAVIADHSQDS